MMRSLEKEISALEKRTAKAEKEADSCFEKDAAKADLADALAQVRDIEALAGDADGQPSAELSDKLVTAEEEVARLREEVSANTALATELEAAEARVEELVAEVEAKKDELAVLQSQRAAAQCGRGRGQGPDDRRRAAGPPGGNRDGVRRCLTAYVESLGLARTMTCWSC